MLQLGVGIGTRRGPNRGTSQIVNEFLRRFLLHILPQGFMRIRHYGLLANRWKSVKLAQCRALLHLPEPQAPPAESAEELLQHLTGIAPHLCPVCGKGHLHPVGPLADPRATGPPQEAVR